jgi:hypothetical protein
MQSHLSSWRILGENQTRCLALQRQTLLGGSFFSFLSVFFWLGSVGLAYQRFKAGSDTAFSQGLGDETMGQDGSQYQGYQEEAGYSEAPFQGGGQQGYQPQQMQY